MGWSFKVFMFTAVGWSEHVGVDDGALLQTIRTGYTKENTIRQAQCAPPVESIADAGYNDAYRGWYDVQGCGECNDYCRWVGNTGSLGDPSVNFHMGQNEAGNPSWWSCRLAGTEDVYSARGLFTAFDFPKCVRKGMVITTTTTTTTTTTCPGCTEPASCMTFRCEDTHHLKSKGNKMCGGPKCSHQKCCKLNPTCMTYECKDTHHLKKKGNKKCGGSKCRHHECCRLNPTPPM